jgi:hypothetical protein
MSEGPGAPIADTRLDIADSIGRVEKVHPRCLAAGQPMTDCVRSMAEHSSDPRIAGREW